MPNRVALINPVGSPLYDDQMRRTVQPFARDDTELTVLHLEGVPEDIAFYVPKHIIEMAILELAPCVERAGYDAIVIGCCFDPGVRVAREAVDIPVVGPLEAALNYASYFGHSYSVVTDSHPKSAPMIRDLVRAYGAGNCRGVHAVDFGAPEMVDQPMQVAENAAAVFRDVLISDGSDLVVIGCTTIAACLEEAIEVDSRYAEIPFLNPTTVALMAAEDLISLRRQGRYRISRAGYYASHRAVNPVEASDVSARFHLIDSSGAQLALVGDGVRVAPPGSTKTPAERAPVMAVS